MYEYLLSKKGVIMDTWEQCFIDQFQETKLLKQRIIMICEGITAEVSQRVTSNLILLDQISSDTLITIYLNSPGGEVTSGFSIFDTIRFIKSPVRIISTGLCASIATIINISVEKKRRLCMPNTKFLIHQPLIMGKIFGHASDIEITAKDIISTKKKINILLAKECEQDLSKIEKDTARDYWMEAEEAVKYGLVGSIITHSDE